MEIYDTKVNHVTNPLGFALDSLTFSWKVRGAQGTRQENARLVIAREQDMTSVLFDSGPDPAANALAYRVNMRLAPRTRYYWTVTVTSDAGEVATSPPQWFETARMSEPWTGRWITCDSANPRHPVFSQCIQPAKPLARARLYITGLGLYEA